MLTRLPLLNIPISENKTKKIKNKGDFYMNKVTLFGRMTADAEAKSVGSNDAKVANFTIAVDGRSKDAETDFIRCVAWNKTAELIATYFKKGRQILVNGNLKTRSYKTEKDGVEFTQNVAEVLVNEVYFINDGKGGSQSNSEQAGAPASSNAGAGHDVPYQPSVNSLENLDSMDAIPSLF